MDKFVENYLRTAADHAECTLQGDYKAGNVLASEIESMNKYIVKLRNKEDAYRLIDDIINSDLPNAIMWITPVCRQQNYNTEKIRRKLLGYSTDKALGILALNAGMLLKTL